MPQRTVLARIEVCVVTAVVEGDRVLGEARGPLHACHSLEDLEQLHAKAVEEVKVSNASSSSSRRSRRAK